MAKLDLRVVVYADKGMGDRDARPLLLRRLVDDLVPGGASHLTIERDESVEVFDRRLISEALHRNHDYPLDYRHVAGHESPLLWVSDAVAWCFRGGDWMRRAAPLIASVIEVGG